MPRKTKQQAEQTRLAILDAAERTFVEKGVSRTSLEEIARRAGCTRGAVYWHFANKLDVLVALMERTDLPLFERFETTVRHETRDPLGAIRSMCLYALSELRCNPHSRNTMEILFHRCEFVGELAPIAQWQVEQTRWFVAETTKVFERAQALGQIRADVAPRFCAIMLHTLMKGLLRELLFLPDSFDIQTAAQQHIDFALQSFGDRLPDAPVLPPCPMAEATMPSACPGAGQLRAAVAGEAAQEA